ncbi:MAG: hypothetical protein H7Y18_08250 [Clostridiaceae bacterium]|nr:hypothetical protein [Clostridiaceae bacterium]
MSKALNIAKGGLFTALTIIFLYISAIVPTSRLSFMALAAAMIPISIISTNVRNSFAVYAASSLLSLLLSLRGTAFMYIVFFGLYGFVKYYVERLRRAILEIVLKLLFFNSSLYLIYLIYTLFTLGLPRVSIPLYYIIAILQVVFIIYDYAMTVIISYMNKRLKVTR